MSSGGGDITMDTHDGARARVVGVVVVIEVVMVAMVMTVVMMVRLFEVVVLLEVIAGG